MACMMFVGSAAMMPGCDSGGQGSSLGGDTLGETLMLAKTGTGQCRIGHSMSM